LPKQKNNGAKKEDGGEDSRKIELKEKLEKMETKSKKRREGLSTLHRSNPLSRLEKVARRSNAFTSRNGSSMLM